MSLYSSLTENNTLSLCSEIVDHTEGRYNILEDGTLMIEDARDTDEGSYECIARNTAGEVKTEAVELRMNTHHHHHHNNNHQQQQGQDLDNQIQRHPGRRQQQQPRQRFNGTYRSRSFKFNLLALIL